MKRLDPSSSLVLLVDVQDKLAAAMPESSMTSLLRAGRILIEAARELGAPVLATEQYPQGLGSTVSELAQLLAGAHATVLSKVEFSAAEAPGFSSELARHACRSVVVIGMETHVCVFQTVRELVQRGLDVHVPIDGVASRREDHRLTGLELCRAAGATITTSETVAFDWLRKASGDAFKKVSRVVR